MRSLVVRLREEMNEQLTPDFPVITVINDLIVLDYLIRRLRVICIGGGLPAPVCMSYRQLGASMWVLGIVPESSGRALSTPEPTLQPTCQRTASHYAL